jgi:hypothetical protein
VSESAILSVTPCINFAFGSDACSMIMSACHIYNLLFSKFSLNKIDFILLVRERTRAVTVLLIFRGLNLLFLRCQLFLAMAQLTGFRITPSYTIYMISKEDDNLQLSIVSYGCDVCFSTSDTWKYKAWSLKRCRKGEVC